MTGYGSNAADAYEVEDLEYVDPELAAWLDEGENNIAPVLFRPTGHRGEAADYFNAHGIPVEKIATESLHAYVRADEMNRLLEDGRIAAAELERPIRFYDSEDEIPDYPHSS